MELFNKNFSLLWGGRLVSNVGDAVHNLALMWVVYEFTESAGITGMIAMASTLPRVLLGPIGGSCADRWNRKLIVVGTDVLRGGLVCVLAYITWNGVLTVPILAAITIVMSMCAAFFNPAISATIPNIVRKDVLTKANSLDNVSMHISLIVGFAIGGGLISSIGVPVAFLVNGISFILSAISEAFINFHQEKRQKIRMLEDVREGFVFIKKNRVILDLILFATVLCFFLGFLGVGVRVVGDSYGAIGYTILLIAQSLGAFIVILTLLTQRERESKHRLYYLLASVCSASLFLLGISSNFYLWIALLFVLNAAITVAGIITIGIFQTMSSDAMRGKVFGIMNSINGASVPVGAGLGGILIELTGVSPVLLGGDSYWLSVRFYYQKFQGLKRCDKKLLCLNFVHTYYI